ncbi:hypothetical protein JQ597_14840 [Bradyrhizobium sp. AUGA SZCCT0177]|nr:hypothetical protein [Bradyrhizobium sp. AUGA SZCCT0177]
MPDLARSRRWANSATLGAAGFAGLPSAIMAGLIHPNRRVLAVCGYGSFMMTQDWKRRSGGAVRHKTRISRCPSGLRTTTSSPTGKSLLTYRNRVKCKISVNQKYFSFLRPKSPAYSRHPVPLRGRRPSSRTLGGLRWTLVYV